MPWENGRKRRYSDVLEDPYKGPQDFMEAGVRGFLVTAIRDREEHSIDESIKILRKTCVKLYGGIKPLRKEDACFAKGYVMVDFMDPEAVVSLPHPDAETLNEEQKAKQATEVAEGKENEQMEQENKPEEAQQETETPQVDSGEAKPENETTEEGDQSKEVKESQDQKKKEEPKKKRKEEEEKSKPLMLAPHKFKGFRTELRNMMFIKSDVPDPMEVVNAAFELILDRKPLYTDCVNQLLPVQGVCDNDYKQLEIMCRRVLVPYFGGEHSEEAPSFGVMLVDKMSEPGAEVLLEVVRSSVWCLNPCAWQCSPFCEPDITIHIEIIGSKIILSAMKQYMKYRQYSPFALHAMGVGKPEDEDNLVKEKPVEKEDKKGNKKGKVGKDSAKSEEKKEEAADGDKQVEEVKDEEGKDEEVKDEQKEGTDISEEKNENNEVKKTTRSKDKKLKS